MLQTQRSKFNWLKSIGNIKLILHFNKRVLSNGEESTYGQKAQRLMEILKSQRFAKENFAFFF